VHQLPYAARPRRRERLVHRMPLEHQGLARRQGGLHHLPSTARRRHDGQRERLHELPRQHRRQRQGRPRRRHGMHDLPQGTRLRPSQEQAGPLCDLSCRGGHARLDEQGPQRLRVVPWRVDSQAHRRPGVRDLPREQSKQHSRDGEGRMRDVPPRPWARGSSRATRVRDVPQERSAPGATLCRGAWRVRFVPFVARAPAVRPRDLHGNLPYRSPDSSTTGAGVHGLPCLPSLAAWRAGHLSLTLRRSQQGP
jgi:hypothetical protein